MRIRQASTRIDTVNVRATVRPGSVFSKLLKVKRTLAVNPYDLQSFFEQTSVKMLQLKMARTRKYIRSHMKASKKSLIKQYVSIFESLLSTLIKLNFIIWSQKGIGQITNMAASIQNEKRNQDRLLNCCPVKSSAFAKPCYPAISSTRSP